MNLISGFKLGSKLAFLFVIFSFVVSSSVIAADAPLPNDSSSLAKQKIWRNLVDQTQVHSLFSSKSTSSPLTARLLELDEFSFKSLLNENSSQSSLSAKTTNNSATTNANSISLPLPDGSNIDVNITPNTVMSYALAQQFPEIKTWKVSDISGDISGVVDFTPQGFRGMLLMPDGDRVFIQPDLENTTMALKDLSAQARYISFSQKQNKDSFKSEFSCGVHDDHSKLDLNIAAKGAFTSQGLSARPAPNLITYRLAVAATGEYTQASGGSISSALSSIVTTISRVNQIYARDLGIVFQLVDEQSDIIYVNPNTDPYINPANPIDLELLLNQNNQNLSSAGALNKNRYDVGHVFGTANVGGLALVGGVCLDDEKAFGATGISNPFGDAFALDYVAHELGHQLGGTHTFNSACGDGSERTGQTAVEPGSGTTIMAYPGICQANNLQNSVDPQFHAVSISQIRGVTREGNGSNCGISSVTGNENPIVNVGDDSTIPARTPIVLIATGSDANNDELTYVWEQSNAGTVSNVNVDTGDNALFRSRPLSTDNVRFIPTLSDLFSGTVTSGELLPVTNRNIEMAVTIRDGKGGLQTDVVQLEVFDTGQQFQVTSQTNNQTLSIGDTIDVRWNVAGTNVTPISCANVDIGLVTANGQGIDIATTANDGRVDITIPDNMPDIDDARLIVSCSSSPFFNISAGRLTIGEGNAGESSGGGGGGSFGLFLLLCSSLLICLRKISFVIR
jgi:hypothetical protein